MQTVFTNAMLVMPNEVVHGSLVVNADGQITEIQPGQSFVKDVVDCEGDWLMPGLVELHTDNLEKHMMPRPGVFWPGPSAFVIHDAQLVAAGITTVFDSVVLGDESQDRNARGKFLKASLEAIETLSALPATRAHHFLHLRCELTNPDTCDHFEKWVDHTMVRLVSVMDHTPGQRQWRDLSKYRQYMERHGRFSEEQFEKLITEGLTAQAIYAQEQRDRILAECRRRQLPVASHDDTDLDHVEQAHSEGIAISEFPTTLEAAQRARELGLKNIMGAPNIVLGGSHSGNVSAKAVAQAGLLDGLSSDYVPSSLLDAVFRLVDELEMSVPDATQVVTKNPADMVGLTDRGSITLGQRADLVWVRRLRGATPVVRQVWRQGVRVC
ncbi:MAG: alpha-D-ribose 1-methylphosphonate 5-triphosphate diphosphatase [Burkholderiaceae bacterium]